MTFKTFHKGGVHPPEHKLTADIPTQTAPLPETAVFPMNQHIGAPARPVVKRGDRVKVGTLLGEANGFVSAPVYSSVSGVVEKIDRVVDATGFRVEAVVVRVEGDDWEDTIDRSDKLETLAAHDDLTAETIVERVRQAGITGMGGAGFPTFIKLTPPPTMKPECVILNGVECEPYITSDYRLMMEHAEEILEGARLMMRAVGVGRTYVGIESNKPQAIALFRQLTEGDDAITVVPLAKKYPQGGEKQLVNAVLGREVPPPPAIPASVGAIVQNVGTAFAVYEAVMKNKPLIERYTTVTGLHVERPANYLTRIGTPFATLISLCGGLPEGENKILAGGPMMGRSVVSTEVPVTKATNCITILTDTDARRKEEQPCMRCAKCVAACPMGLEPYLLSTLSEWKEWDKAERDAITSCIECGSCQYTCPSHRPLLDRIRTGKQTVIKRMKQRKE